MITNLTPLEKEWTRPIIDSGKIYQPKTPRKMDSPKSSSSSFCRDGRITFFAGGRTNNSPMLLFLRIGCSVGHYTYPLFSIAQCCVSGASVAGSVSIITFLFLRIWVKGFYLIVLWQNCWAKMAL